MESVRVQLDRTTFKKLQPLIAVVILLMSTSLVSATDEVLLNNGDKLSGRIIDVNNDRVILEHDALGTLTLDQGVIQTVKREHQESIVTLPVLPAATIAWDREIEAGYDLARGNTKEEKLSGRISAHRKTDDNELTFKATAVVGSANEKMDEQKYYAMGRYGSSFGSQTNWYHFYKLEADHDRFANIDWRVLPSAGIGYWFADEADWKLMAEVGVGFEVTEFRAGDSNQSDPVVIPRAFAKRALWRNSTIAQDIELIPNLGDSGEYRLKAETVLTSALTQAIALRLRLLDEYNSKPGVNTKKNDLRMTSSLVYAF